MDFVSLTDGSERLVRAAARQTPSLSQRLWIKREGEREKERERDFIRNKCPGHGVANVTDVASPHVGGTHPGL